MWLADLLALWQAHGTGLVAKHALLHFQDGALTAPSPASGIYWPLSSQHEGILTCVDESSTYIPSHQPVVAALCCFYSARITLPSSPMRIWYTQCVCALP